MKKQSLFFKFILVFFLFNFWVSPSFSQVMYYFEGECDNYFTAYDLQLKTEIATVELAPGYPSEINTFCEKEMHFSPDKSKVFIIESYVPKGESLSKIIVVDLKTFELKQISGIVHTPYGGVSNDNFRVPVDVIFHPTKSLMFVRSNRDVFVIDSEYLTLQDRIIATPFYEVFWSMVLSKDGSKLIVYSTNRYDDNPSDYEVETFRVFDLNTIPFGNETTYRMEPGVRSISGSNIKTNLVDFNMEAEGGYGFSWENLASKTSRERSFAITSYDISDLATISGTRIDDKVEKSPKFITEKISDGFGNYVDKIVPNPLPVEETFDEFIAVDPSSFQHIKIYTKEHQEISPMYSSLKLNQIEVIDSKTGIVQNTFSFNLPTFSIDLAMGFIQPFENKYYFISFDGQLYACYYIDLQTGDIEKLLDFPNNILGLGFIENNTELGLMAFYTSSGAGKSRVMVYDLNSKALLNGPENIQTTTVSPSRTSFDSDLQHRILFNNNFSPSTFAYIPNRSDNTVSVIDVNGQGLDNQAKVTIPVGESPRMVAVSVDNSRVYIGNVEDETVSVIQAYTNMVSETFSVGARPIAIAVSPDHEKIVVTTKDATGAGNERIRIFETKTYTEVANYSVGLDPDGIAIANDGTIYVLSP